MSCSIRVVGCRLEGSLVARTARLQFDVVGQLGAVGKLDVAEEQSDGLLLA